MPFDLFAGEVLRNSITEYKGVTYALGHTEVGERVLLISSPHPHDLDPWEGDVVGDTLLMGPISEANAAVLRARLPWLNPVPLGLRTSFGFGDRMGLATPGHIDALRAVQAEGIIAAIFAQQSVRENTRTHRTPQEVMDAATWGILQEGWREAWGADADHVKQIDDLDAFIAAGYTFYTIDPSDHVDNEAESDSAATLRDKVSRLPWDALGTSWSAMRARYCLEPFALGGFGRSLDLAFDEVTLLRGLAKYGRAIAHTLAVAAALSEKVGSGRFELEMSVDETETPTSAHEHFLIANELVGRGLPVVSLAPRFVGKFQKGVDYMGDLDVFASELARHAAIRDHFDSYKISIHTGSDKFSIYPAIAAATHGKVHVKTAGTSYLEALRVVAEVEPALFRTILADACAVFERDRHSYFLDAELAKVPDAASLSDGELPALLDQFDTRQVLHVAFGTILVKHGAQINDLMETNEGAYRAVLAKHFVRHLQPFVTATP